MIYQLLQIQKRTQQRQLLKIIFYVEAHFQKIVEKATKNDLCFPCFFKAADGDVITDIQDITDADKEKKMFHLEIKSLAAVD